MTKTEKQVHGVLSFIPLALWFVWCAYILVITRDLVFSQSYEDHEKVVTALSMHFNGVMSIWIVAVIATFIMLLFNVVHLARIRTMHGGNKALWMVIMVAFAPVAFPIFWFMQIKGEPANIATYADIR